ncbi:MAG: hypothetical protein AAF330_04070 [Pseudomonadota bacterium]
MPQCVSLSFFRYGRWIDRLWAFAQMGFARPALARVPGIGFWKLCGSGTGEGFTPIPNTSVYAVLATWDGRDAAHAGLDAAVFWRFRKRAVESWTVQIWGLKRKTSTAVSHCYSWGQSSMP